jgi:hypothetical protein
MRATVLLRILRLIATLSLSAAPTSLDAASLAPAGQITVGTSFPALPNGAAAHCSLSTQSKPPNRLFTFTTVGATRPT